MATLPTRYRWVILALAFLSQLTATLAASVVPPLAPILQSELGLTKAEIGLFSSAALAGSWGILLVGGYWTQRFGVRRMMALGQAGAGGVMLTMALAGSFLQAFVVMFVVGLCRGLVQPGASKAIMDWFPSRERATAMGIKQTGYPMGGILMAATLPALALALGWRNAIALVGLLIVAGGIGIAILYRNPPGEKRTAGPGVGMRNGMAQLVQKPRLWLLSIIALLLVAAQMGVASYLALYFAEVVLLNQIPEEGVRIIVAGGFLALLQAGGVVGRVSWGVVSDRLLLGRRMPAIAIIGVVGSLMALAMGYLSPGLPLWLLGILVFFYGTTALGWNGLYHALAVETSGRKLAALGVGLTMTVTQAGTVGGPPLFGFIVDLSGTYQAAWLCLSLISLIGALVAALSGKGERAAPAL